MTALALAIVAALLLGACTSPPPRPAPTPAPSGKAMLTATSVGPLATPTAQPAPTATPKPVAQGPTFVLLRSKDITAGARLNFMGQGFQPGEQTEVTVEDAKGALVATFPPVNVEEDGRINEVSVPVPAALMPGAHTLQVVGAQSGNSARVTFRVRWLPPTVKLEAYSGKAKHSFSFSGAGFAPDEQVEVRLGGLGGSPLATFPADPQGNVVGQDVPIPLIQAGDYPLYFVGSESQSPVSVGFNVQGFRPWAVLDNYSPPPYHLMGFSGEDFVPDEQVLVYLNDRTLQPVTRVQADANGRIALKNAFELPALKGEQRVIFVGLQSNVEITASFIPMAFGPGLEMTTYSGRPGSYVAFVGTGWARGETLRVFIGDKQRHQVGTFQADASGAFRDAGRIRLPIPAEAGGLPLTVRGDVSQAEVTLWFQVLELKPSAELSAYEGPPGTVVSFTGRGFAGGERVHVHLRTRDGPELAQAVANEDGTFEQLSSYPVQGQWGDDATPFVIVGEESRAEATTHFRFGTP